MKNLLSIYNTFRSNTLLKKKNKDNERSNDFVKGIKSILANKIKFK